ncbi:MAG: PAS domain S-box protein [Cryobacterium sp.]|nr:PAS domain S-box protein [Oligoflexia bacterium]
MVPLDLTGYENVFFRCVEDCSEAIMISDQSGSLAYVNPAWTTTYGYSSSEAIGQHPKMINSGCQTSEFYESMWNDILNPAKRHWKGELINRAKNGTLVPVLLTITPVKSPDGTTKGYMGIAVDMTSMKEMEAKVAHQDRLASVGTLASGLAHEIGTPLGVIRGRAEFLKMKTGDFETQRELTVVMNQTDRISTLIRSLLRVSRSSSDAFITDVSLAEVVNEVFSLVGELFRVEEIALELDIDPKMSVRADSSRLEQVFLNLMMNSLHAVQEAKGRGKPGPHRILIRLQEQHGQKKISVKDSGCGIPKENLRKLFKPFYTTKDVGKGSGLGLAIVSQLLSEMDAQISAKSEPGEGATFTISLEKNKENETFAV